MGNAGLWANLSPNGRYRRRADSRRAEGMVRLPG